MVRRSGVWCEKSADDNGAQIWVLNIGGRKNTCKRSCDEVAMDERK